MDFKQWCIEKRAEGRRLSSEHAFRVKPDGTLEGVRVSRLPKPDYERLGFAEREDAEGRN